MFRMTRRISAVEVKIVVLCLLGLMHVLMTFVAVVPGYLSIDEAIYHLMVKNFAATGGLEIWTGYHEYPSVELTHDFLRIHAGRTVSQYPYLFPVVALPLYAVAGFYGLFLTNSLAFVGIVALCYAMAQKLYHDTNLSLNSCLILVLATFSWEYSQSAWPPTMSVLFILGAFYAMVSAYYAESKNARLLYASIAGLIGGFAPGVHMTTAIILPCLVLPFLFAKPWRPVEAVLVVALAIPGLAVLAWTNHIKFGVLTPFSYGTGISRITPSVPGILVWASCGSLLAVWIWTRISTSTGSGWRRWAFFGIVAAALIAAVLVPQTRRLLLRLLDGAWQMLVDLRVRDTNIQEAALGRTATGGLVYIGGLKKSLLQSLPYLTVLFVPAAALVRRREDFAPLAMLFLVPLSVTVYFSYLLDHGGLSLNMRYFLPVLPFTSILAAYAMRDIQRGHGIWSYPGACCATVAAAAGGYYLLAGVWAATFRDLEFVLLTISLFPALLLLALLVAREAVGKARAGILGNLAWVALIAGLVWSSLVSFTYDYPLHRRQRAENYNFGGNVVGLIPSDSVFFTAPYIDPFLRLIEKDRVRIALPTNDRFKDFPKVVDYYLEAGKRVFAVFPVGFWKDLKAGPLADYVITPIFQFPGSFVAEITRQASLTGPSTLPKDKK